MSPLRVLGVGAGYFSQFHYLGWQRIAEVRCIGIVELDAAKARRQAERFRIGSVFDELGGALRATRPDLVDIITPPPTHRTLVGTCVAHGVPVICQKAFGRDYAEALAITRLGEAAGVTVAVHENVRWQPWYREAKRMLDGGRLGSLHSVAFRLRPGDGQGPDAYLDRQPYFQQMPQLLLKETAIHWIDTFRYLAGEVKSVYATLRRMNPSIAGEDAGILVFEFESGSTGLFDGNRLNDHVAGNPRRTMGEAWIEGSAGVLRLDGEARLWWKPHHGDEVEHPYDRGPDDSFGGGACEWLQRHVVAHLRSGSALENRARDYLANLRVQEAAYLSATTHCRVEMAGFDPLRLRR